MATKTVRSSISRLTNQLSEVNQKLVEIAKEIAVTDQTTNMYWSRQRKEVRDAYNKARGVYGSWNKENVPYFYKQNQIKQIEKINSMKYSPPKELNENKFFNSFFNKYNINEIMTQSISDYFTGLDSGEKQYNRLLASSQKYNNTIKQLDQASKEGFQEFGSTAGAQRKVRDQLLKNSLDGKNITIIDKNGRPRRYKLDTYAEMVTRTQLRNAQTQGTIQVGLAYGSDLVQVSSHNTKTPYDAQFEGKIFSLSGKDPDFPPATELPPYHPNCIHTISVFFKDAHSEKEIEKISDFSKGKTETHPTRKSHIPVSNRGK
jgi:hypothetical protein